MKKILITLLFVVGSAYGVQAQVQMGFNPGNKNPNAQKEQIKKMTPAEKREWLNTFRENMLVEDLNIPEKDRAEFKKVYSEYQDNQRRIKEKFNNNFDPEKLSDSEARKKLDESFSLGQQLLDNRKDCAMKMQNVVRPQQVLKMFQTEGQMREKMFNKKMELKNKEIGNANPETPQNHYRTRR
ncbi:MAG: hypothetical protein Q4G16_03045 [Cruoricaptor ignavus]|nr:hypothetical protein [Cruoricaptor ignavus]